MAGWLNGYPAISISSVNRMTEVEERAIMADEELEGTGATNRSFPQPAPGHAVPPELWAQVVKDAQKAREESDESEVE